ncbi:MAG: sporulation protein [candidate division Zixibacteria bacterium]|nr:sporulation protein [candidate division Zixibacteria bacterium]
MPSTAEAIIKTLMDEIKTITKTETILGDPITVGNNTIIPVCRIMVGFGAGGGEGEMKEKRGGSGGGGGGGLRVEPAAFIVVKGDQVSIMGTKPSKLEGLVEAVPGIIEKIQKAKKAKKEEEKEGEK